MPDTAIFGALRGILNEEEDNVTAQELKEWLSRVEGKLDGQNTVMSAHGERIAKLEEKATAAHRRVDEIVPKLRSAKGPGLSGWAAIILALGTAIAGCIAAYHGEKTADKQPKADVQK